MALSKRGLKKVMSQSSEHIAAIFKAWHNVYDRETNPDGFIIMSVAENKLGLDLVTDRLNAVPEIPSQELLYGTFHGAQSTREVVAGYFKRFHTKMHVDPEHLILHSSVGSIMDTLAVLFCDLNEHIMLTVPGYYGFAFDISIRADTYPVLVDMQHLQDSPMPSIESFQAAYDKAKEEGHNIRAIVIMSPDNPSGIVLKPEMLEEIIIWARSHSLHIIVDELYAQSIHNKNRKFTSIVSILENKLGDDVHVIWSLSKDFCASGLRMAVLYTQNEQVLSAMKTNLSVFSSTSRQVQWQVTHMLNDHDWVASFVNENMRRVHSSYNICTKMLTALGISYFPADAGFFLIADFRKWMKSPTLENEMKLWRLMGQQKIILTPSHEMMSSKYGFFRICYAAMPAEELRLGMERLGKALKIACSI